MSNYILLIPDIHGCFDIFIRTLEMAEMLFTGALKVYFGDYVDRGPKSYEVLEKVMQDVKDGHLALLGNHEYGFIHSTINSYESAFMRVAASTASSNSPESGYGFTQTIQSFERIHGSKFNSLKEFQAFCADRGIIDFLKELPLVYNIENWVFTHAPLNRNCWINSSETDPLSTIMNRNKDYTDIYATKNRLNACGHQITETHTPVYIPSKGLYLNCGLGASKYGRFYIGILSDFTYIGAVNKEGFLKCELPHLNLRLR